MKQLRGMSVLPGASEKILFEVSRGHTLPPRPRTARSGKIAEAFRSFMSEQKKKDDLADALAAFAAGGITRSHEAPHEGVFRTEDDASPTRAYDHEQHEGAGEATEEHPPAPSTRPGRAADGHPSPAQASSRAIWRGAVASGAGSPGAVGSGRDWGSGGHDRHPLLGRRLCGLVTPYRFEPTRSRGHTPRAWCHLRARSHRKSP